MPNHSETLRLIDSGIMQVEANLDKSQPFPKGSDMEGSTLVHASKLDDNKIEIVAERKVSWGKDGMFGAMIKGYAIWEGTNQEQINKEDIRMLVTPALSLVSLVLSVITYGALGLPTITPPFAEDEDIRVENQA